MMQSHVRFDSRIYQTSSCLQHGIIPLAIFHSQLRFLLCVVDADCHASVLTDHELRAVGCDSVRVGRRVSTTLRQVLTEFSELFSFPPRNFSPGSPSNDDRRLGRPTASPLFLSSSGF